MSQKKFVERIQSLDNLTPSEIKIADYFSRNYSDIIFENVSTISANSGVSKATVVRFIAKLGFERFADFKKEMRNEIDLTHDSLHIRYSLKKKLFTNIREDILGYSFSNIINNLEETYKNIPQNRLTEVAQTIATCGGRIFITGQRSSYALAYIFYNMVRRLLPNAALIETQTSNMPEELLDVCSRDILFAIFRHPYAKQTSTIAKYFHDNGATVLLLTDSDFNPLSELSQKQLVVRTEGVSIFTSSTAIVALLESLNISLLKYCDDSVSKRLEKAERLYDFFDIYCKKS